MWMQINQAWLSLDAREQMLLKVLAGFLLLVLLYLFIWSPITSHKKQAETQLKNSQQEWQWLNQQVPAAQALQSSMGGVNQIKVTSQNSLMSLLQNSLREQNLFKDVKTLEGVAKGGNVTFEKVNATRLFKWLSLIEQQGAVPATLQMVWLEPGLVKADMQFKTN
ncbi:hypothetical protein JCM30760_03560 [Thiomicrorhabdus hydrogeniphila]